MRGVPAAKTNAVRLLESRGVTFGLASYPVDASALDAVTAAAKLGVEPERVFKTLVTRGDRGDVFVFCIPGPSELDLKKAARAIGGKKVEMVRAGELLELTGYVRGGCSPIGMKRPYPLIVDESVQLFDTVCVSAGVRGLQLVIGPEALLAVTGGRLADVAS
jgi:Cys-tRNA(Pro)/Cys-tRNA(Cys) deacylase